MSKIKIDTQWQTISYDVWGNENDGYQVNDCFKGELVDITIELTSHNQGTANEFYSGQPTDLQIKHALGINPRIAIEDSIQSENSCYPEHASTGYPLGQLDLESHDSLEFKPIQLVIGHTWLGDSLFFTLANSGSVYAGKVCKDDSGLWGYLLDGSHPWEVAQSDSDTIKPLKKTAKNDLMQHAIETLENNYQFVSKYKQHYSLGKFKMNATIETNTKEYIAELNEKYGDIYHFSIDDKGKKYKRIVRQDKSRVDGSIVELSGSAHGFIEVSTGDLYKAASWKTPAKNFSRGNVITKRNYGKYSID